MVDLETPGSEKWTPNHDFLPKGRHRLRPIKSILISTLATLSDTKFRHQKVPVFFQIQDTEKDMKIGQEATMEIGGYPSKADPGPRIWVLVYRYIYIY